MNWLSTIVDKLVALHTEGEILIESGGSPSGEYHLGHMRELVICDAILLELRKRGHKARHIYFIDDMDALRKIPANIPSNYEKYLGRPLYDIPSPDPDKSYAEYFIDGLKKGCESLGVEVEFVRAHEKYQSGFFTDAIEKSLDNVVQIKDILETISSRKLGDEWSPIQVNEEGYLKKRRFISMDKKTKTLEYEDKNSKTRTISYNSGDIKLDWRIDWPARWWLLGVAVEPFGRDHASAGGSYDTGKEVIEKVFKAEAPLPVKYDFINLFGDTKKMSASKGTGLSASEATGIIPSEVMRYFILNAPPNKLLHFDPIGGLTRLMDEFAALLAKPDKDERKKRLVELCVNEVESVVSSVPFSHLVASYQSALKDPHKTLETIARTEHAVNVKAQKNVILSELKFIDGWLSTWAPEEVKFNILKEVNPKEFSQAEKDYLKALAGKIESGPKEPDAEWLHKAVYEFKDNTKLEPKQLFQTLYKVLIGKDSGPRAGWFLSTLPKDWLVSRLRFEG
ncbi:MAG TPA: lysine--tRNA ligase [Candidatus Saccharimonadales bacterium]|nr:lysine--tRNA ligase [Candidatus Saccharimonadales bacterium]